MGRYDRHCDSRRDSRLGDLLYRESEKERQKMHRLPRRGHLRGEEEWVWVRRLLGIRYSESPCVKRRGFRF